MHVCIPAVIPDEVNQTNEINSTRLYAPYPPIIGMYVPFSQLLSWLSSCHHFPNATNVLNNRKCIPSRLFREGKKRHFSATAASDLRATTRSKRVVVSFYMKTTNMLLNTFCPYDLYFFTAASVSLHCDLSMKKAHSSSSPLKHSLCMLQVVRLFGEI